MKSREKSYASLQAIPIPAKSFNESLLVGISAAFVLTESPSVSRKIEVGQGDAEASDNDLPRRGIAT
jgi:hypothetical protein